MIVLTGLILHLPTIRYQWEYGRNAITDREPEEADAYGMKLAHLILPIPDHNLRVLANFRVHYLVPNRPCEGESAGGLGIVGTAGLLGLIIAALFPGRRSWPYGPLVGLTLFAILLATIGGFGSVFNLIATSRNPGVQSHWRLHRVPLLLRRPVGHRPVPPGTDSTRASRIRYAAWAGVFLMGFFDQTPFAWFKSGIVKTIDRQADASGPMARFFAEIEQSMSPGSKVFCLPYAPFPEHKPIEKMPIYEHARGYIHTNSLYWSFGAVKGREVDAWQRDVATPMTTRKFDKLPAAVPEFVDRIVCAGFDGLLIDTRGFAPTKDGDRARTIEDLIHDRYEALVAARTRQPRPKDNASRLRLPRVAHEDNRQFFLDLRPYRDELRQALPQHYEATTRHEQDWVALLWLDGFESPEEPGFEDLMRFAPCEATAVFINPSDRTQKFALTMSFNAETVGRFQVRLSGLVTDEFNFVRSAVDPARRQRRGKEFANLTWFRSPRAATRSDSIARRRRTSLPLITGVSATTSCSSTGKKSVSRAHPEAAAPRGGRRPLPRLHVFGAKARIFLGRERFQRRAFGRWRLRAACFRSLSKDLLQEGNAPAAARASTAALGELARHDRRVVPNPVHQLRRLTWKQ